MKPHKRVFLKVNPKEEYKQGEIYTMHHYFGAETEGTIKHGKVWKVPNEIDWLKEGDTVWFTQQASQQQGHDNIGQVPCMVYEQEEGELWALSIDWAYHTILGIQRGDVLISTPRYIAALPIEKEIDTELDIEFKSLNAEQEVRAISIENKEGIKEGDVIHFQQDTDYPSKEMQSNWIKRDGKRVLFLRLDYVFGYESKGVFKPFRDWVIYKSLDEGDAYKETSFGIFIPRTDLADVQGDGEVAYCNSNTVSVKSRIKCPKRGFRSLEVNKERLYAIKEEDIWLEYA